MNTCKIVQASRLHLTTFSAIGALVISGTLLVACGGGGGGVGSAGTGVTPTGYSAGTVTAKGSSIVNGVEFFDDTATDVRGEDDVGGHSGDDVKIGMEVEIEHGAITCPTGPVVATCSVLPRATATKISYGNNSIVAPISNFVPRSAPAVVPATFEAFDLLGQHVVATASTTISLDSSVTALADGVVVEVHGVYDPVSKVTTATRIEVKAASSATLPVGVFYRLRGILTLTGGTATIGTTTVNLNGVSTTDASGASLDGQLVRAKLDSSTTPPKVLALTSAQRKLDDQKGRDAEVEGVIDADPTTAVNGDVSFTVRGAAVLVPKALVSAILVKGARIELEGHVNQAGILVATRVSAHNEANDGVGALEEFHTRIVKPNPVDNALPAFVNTHATTVVGNTTVHTFESWTTVPPYVLVKTIKIIGDGTHPGDTKFSGNKGRDFSLAAMELLGPGGLVVVSGHSSADGKTITAISIQNDTSTE